MDKKIKLSIIEQKTIAEKTREVSFGLSGQEFNFLAGQYIRVSLPNLLYSDPKGSSRLFSISSSPNDKEKISTAFRDSGSGFKRTLMELPAGSLIDPVRGPMPKVSADAKGRLTSNGVDPVRNPPSYGVAAATSGRLISNGVGTEGPFGYFTLPKNSSQPIVFIAGGIGITPCLSMIRFAGEQKLGHRITLIYTNKNEAGAAYLKELTTIAQENSNFSLKIRYKRVDADFIRQSVDNLGEQIWYVVGLPSMVADTRNILSGLGIENTKIYSEDFTGYE